MKSIPFPLHPLAFFTGVVEGMAKKTLPFMIIFCQNSEITLLDGFGRPCPGHTATGNSCEYACACNGVGVACRISGQEDIAVNRLFKRCGRESSLRWNLRGSL